MKDLKFEARNEPTSDQNYVLSFDLGDWVKVHRISHKFKTQETEQVSWDSIRLSKPKLGRICGLRRKFGGKVIRHIGYDGCAYLKITKSYLFYEVRFGWLNNPVLVAECDMILCSSDEIKEIPILYFTRGDWNERDKQILREDCKDWPRDKKGRWIKEKYE